MPNIRLSDGSNNLDFDPLVGMYQQRPDAYYRELNESVITGSIFEYQWGAKKRYELEFNNLPYAYYTLIKTWQTNMTSLKIYYDFIANPANYTPVRIIDPEIPVQMMFITWRNVFEGMITLYEIGASD